MIRFSRAESPATVWRNSSPARNPGLPRDLVYGGLPAQLLFQHFAALHGFVGGVAQAAADPQSVVVAQKAPDLANDHGHAVGGKPHRLAGIEVVDGLDQPDAAHLEQIVQVFAPLGKALDDAQNQPQVALDHLLPGGGVPGLCLHQQGALFLLRKHGQL